MRACRAEAFTLSLCDKNGVISEKSLGRLQSLHLGDLGTIHGVLLLRFLFSYARQGITWLCCGPNSVFDKVASLPGMVRAGDVTRELI